MRNLFGRSSGFERTCEVEVVGIRVGRRSNGVCFGTVKEGLDARKVSNPKHEPECLNP
jgi:hypothetical protein